MKPLCQEEEEAGGHPEIPAAIPLETPVEAYSEIPSDIISRNSHKIYFWKFSGGSFLQS